MIEICQVFSIVGATGRRYWQARSIDRDADPTDFDRWFDMELELQNTVLKSAPGARRVYDANWYPLRELWPNAPS